MLLKNRLKELKSTIKNKNVLESIEERYCYATDASNINHPHKIPEAVVFVETIEDVQNVVQFSAKHGIPIIPRGAGTNMVGACVSTKGGIVLNFSKMNKILEINKANMTATVQSGVIVGDLKAAVEEFGLFYPPDPSSYKVSTIGGGIAQSSGGAMSFKYGTTKDYVLSLKVVTADGSLISLGTETIKNSVGYHLAQLMVGSEGTLGIIVEATLKLIPKPETKRTVAAYFNDISDAVKAVNGIIANRIFPSAIDFMDKSSMETVEDYSHSGLLTENNCMLLIDLDGFKSSMDDMINRTCSILNEYHSTQIDTNKGDELWQARRASFSAVTRLAPDVVSDDIIVPREKLAEMVNECLKIKERYNLKMCLVGHVGDGNIHPQIALNLENEYEYKNYLSAKSEMYKKALELGGTISAEHGIGIEKLPYLGNTIDKNALIYMRSIKKIFDPKNILNPGKIFD
jgi:glycolate oxidase